MGRVNNTISNVNSALRTVLMLVVTGVAGVGGYKAYELYNAPLQKLADKEAELEKARNDLTQTSDKLTKTTSDLSERTAQLAEKAAQVERLEVAMKLLKVRHRLARLRVVSQQKVAAADATPPATTATPTATAEKAAARPDLVTKIEFTEINEQGTPIGESKQFDIAGDMVYVDFLRVTFDDKYIEQSDLDRSTSLALFQRIFGEHQEPADGYQLDTVGTRPTAYDRGTPMSDFEKKIWDDFWLIANDPKKAADLGIRAAHGDAVSMRVRPNMTYEIDLRSTGEISARAVEPSPPKAIIPGSGN